MLFSWSFRVEKFCKLHSLNQAAVSSRPLPSRPGRTAGSPWVPGAPGRGAGGAHPPDALDRSSWAPRPGRGWGRAAGSARQPRLHNGARGFSGCLGAPQRIQLSRQEPASLARVISARVQDAELCFVSGLHDPEYFGRRKEGAPCQHLQPRWPRHDPLLLCQCGHLAERHQPAVSLPLQMLRKFAFPSGFSQYPRARTS